MTGARPVRATIMVDHRTGSEDITALAQMDGQIGGSHPFVRVLRIAVQCPPLDLLPAEAVVERCVTTDSAAFVLARLADASIRVAAHMNSVDITVTATSSRRADEVGEAMRARALRAPTGTANVSIWFQAGLGFATHDRAIAAPEWSAISSNYPAGTRSMLDTLARLQRPTAQAKLLLWHGPPGTGKTTAVRALLREWKPWCEGNYIADPERFFAEPAYITQVLASSPSPRSALMAEPARQPETKWRLVVAEDTDQYLRSTARRDAGASLGRLLNLADGVLGHGLNVLILLTTNEEITRLHPALVRPGRCLASVAFSAFSQSEAAAWLGDDRQAVDGPMTLAELLEARGDLTRVGGREAATTTIGQYL